MTAAAPDATVPIPLLTSAILHRAHHFISALRPSAISAVNHLHRPAVIALTVVCIWWLAAAPADAQIGRLDDGQFTRGLAERGMNDLLLYYVENNPSDDPQKQLVLRAEVQKIRAADTNLDDVDRRAAMADVISCYDQLLKLGETDAAIRLKKPIWLTDLTQFLLFTALPAEQNAALFVEFGVPTDEQRRRFDDLTTRAVTAIEDAAWRWFTLQTELRAMEIENEDLRYRLKEQYGGAQIPYYRAFADYFAALQADDGPYFQTVQKQRQEEGEPFEVKAERRKLLEQAVSALAQLKDRAERLRITTDVYSLTGRAQSLLGQYDSAIQSLAQAVESAEAGTAPALLARLAQIVAHQRADRLEQAEQTLADVRKDPQAANTLWSILLADRDYLIRRSRADAETDPARKQQRLAEAYQVYVDVLTDQRVRDDPELLTVLKQYMFGRIAEQVPADTDLAKLPPMVALAVGVTAVNDGQEQINSANQSDDEATAGKLRTAAAADFKRGSEVLAALLNRANLPNELSADALYYLGLAAYLSGQEVAAATRWVDLADRHPDMTVSEAAIGYALQLARNIYRDNPKNAVAVDLHERMFKVLLEKFPTTEMASTHSYTYAQFLHQQKRYAEAVEAFERVGEDHDLYVDGRFLKLASLRGQWALAVGNAKSDLIRPVLDAVDECIAAVSSVAPDKADERLDQMQAQARIWKAEMLIESLGRYADALKLLADFDSQFGAFPGLVGDAKALRIRILQRQESWAEAEAEIEQLLVNEEFRQAVGAIILSVLEGLNREIAELQQEQQADKVRHLAGIAARLAQRLLDWAATQPMYQDEQNLLPFRVQHGEALLWAGQYDDAIEAFEAALNTEPTNIDANAGLAEAHFSLDDYAKAKPYYDKLIENIPDARNPVKWKAWAQRLTIADADVGRLKAKGEPKYLVAAKRVSEDIFLRIRQLEAVDPELGGDPFKQTFIRLRVKHQPRP